MIFSKNSESVYYVLGHSKELLLTFIFLKVMEKTKLLQHVGMEK